MNKSDFNRQLMKHRKMLYSFIFSIVRDHTLAEDTFQDVAVVAIEKCAVFKAGTDMGAWLREIARRKIMKARENSRRNDFVALDPEALEAVENAYGRVQEEEWSNSVEALEYCKKKVPKRGRLLIDLRYEEGLDFDSIARRMKSTANSVQATLCKIRQQLRQCIEMFLSEGR